MTPDDLARFSKLGISQDTLTSAGIRRVTHHEAVDVCGIRYKSDHLEGIAYPYVNPTTGQTTSWRVRRDHPEHDADGKLIAKYLSSPDRKHFYYAPDATKAMLADVMVDVIVVEAESSVLCLHDARVRLNKLPRLLIGLGGCHGWRGVIGKTVDADGTRVDEKGPLPDFDRIAWTGRNVTICFDANALTNTSVQTARNGLAAELKRRGADVFIAALPEFSGNGPDDFAAEFGDEPLWSLLDGARRWSAAGAKREKRAADGSAAVATSQASLIVELAQAAGIELFHDDQTAYVSVHRDDHRETYKLRSKAARGYLVGLHLDATKKAPGSQGVADATTALEALALREGEQRVYVRIAAVENHIYLDLANDAWQVVDIDRERWRVIVDPPVKFRRPKGLLPLPVPVTGGSVLALRRFVNVEKPSDFLLVLAVLIAYLRGRGPYPSLVLNGEQGAAKSTLTRVMKALIDPNTAPLRSAPKEPRDLMIAASHAHALGFDNLSVLPDWLSDALCRLATGGGFSTRTLYSDDEEMIFDAVRPVIINGIAEVATRQDLVGRSVFVTMPPIPSSKRRAESTLWAAFDRAHPAILGALLTIVSVALKNEPDVTLANVPRMADFARWIVAAEPACPWKAGGFLEVYTANQDTALTSTLDGDLIADLVRGLLHTPAHLSLSLPWTGTAKDLLAALNDRVADHIKRQKGFPSQPRSVANQLRRLAPALRLVGIDVMFAKASDRDRTRTITVTQLEEKGTNASASSASSDMLETQDLSSDEASDEAQTASSAHGAEPVADGVADATSDATSDEVGRSADTGSSAEIVGFARKNGHADAADAADAAGPLPSKGEGQHDEDDLSDDGARF
jgi:hypothetical protein